jgi:endonuclease/exonuclease/phosphatase family metal-dependent hydrolase
MAAQAQKRKSSKTGKKKSGKSIFFGLTSRVLMLIMAGLMAVSYLSFIINPARLWLISLFGLAFIPLLAANFTLLIWAIMRRSKAFVIPLVAILPCVFFLGRYVQVPVEEDVPQGDPDLEVVTYNLGRFALSGKRVGIAGRTQCADSIFTYLRQQNADIICLQEFYVSSKDVASFRQYVKGHFPGYHAEYYMFPGKHGSFGNVTLSRIPVLGKGVVKFEESANLAIYTDHRVGDKRFRVYNCHFESYNISFTGMIRSLFRSGTDVFSETGIKMKKSISRRPKQVDKVFSHIEGCPYEAFVCGDFNDNPMSYTYYRMTRGRKDAFVAAGTGFGATYSRLWPLLRIDYVLVPDAFRSSGYNVHRKGFSDHYPVVAEIKF